MRVNYNLLRWILRHGLILAIVCFVERFGRAVLRRQVQAKEALKVPPVSHLKLTLSKEDSLKAIAEAESEEGSVVAATIARWLEVTPPR